MTKNELSTLMARTIKGDFVDFTECANEVFKEFERIQSENKELKKSANAYIQAKYVRTCRDFHKLAAENDELKQTISSFHEAMQFYSGEELIERVNQYVEKELRLIKQRQ